MQIDRIYLLCALAYAVIGISLGIYMAASHNPMQHVTHAHILLVGFLMSFIYGVIHKLWINRRMGIIGIVQFVAHQAGAIGIMTGLFLLYGRFVTIAQIEAFLATASVSVLVGLLLMFYMLLAEIRSTATT